MRTTIALACIATLLGACANVVRVNEKKGDEVEPVKGIPFYVKTQTFQQVTVYRQTWLRARLTVTPKSSDPKASGAQEFTRDLLKSRDLAAAQKDQLSEFKQVVLKANGETIDLPKLIADFNALPGIDLEQNRPAPDLVSNTVASEWGVDRTRTYYLNAPLPWFGSGNLTQKLADNGTLQEVVSAPDTKLAEGLSSLIPFKEYLSGEFVKKQPDTEASSLRPPPLYELSLVLDEVGYEYSLSTQPSATPLVPKEPLKFSTVIDRTALFTRKAIGGDAKAEAPKDEGQKIGISGNISFPKDWPGKQ